MSNEQNSAQKFKADHVLDITSDICPMTFVKTKLMLERIAAGEILEIRLKGLEPLKNVPRSVQEYGHEILNLYAEDPDNGEAGPHRLLIRKA